MYRPTVSLYHDYSLGLDTLDSQTWERNQQTFTQAGGSIAKARGNST